MGQAQSSKFLADIDFSKPSVEDIHQIMEYFHAQKEPGKEECLNTAQARRFLGKLCKYQHIPAHRSANFVDYLMDRLDKNKDGQLSFEELSDQELWKEVFVLVAGAKTDSEEVWTEKLKAKPEEKCASPPTLTNSLDTTFAAAALSPVGSKALVLGPEDKPAEDFWTTIEGGDAIQFAALVSGLAETWECSDNLAQTIVEMLLPPNAENVIKKREFYRFVRAFGPWGEGANNVMLRFIVGNLFKADGTSPRGVFHANIDEKKSRIALKNRGDFLYRYSSHYPNGINITRLSTNAALTHVAEALQNNRNGAWIYDGTVYASLWDFETALKAKLLNPILFGETATTSSLSHHYSSSLTGASLPTENPVNHYSTSLTGNEQQQQAGSPRSNSPTRGSVRAAARGSTMLPASPTSLMYSNSLTPQSNEAQASPDPYYAKGMAISK